MLKPLLSIVIATKNREAYCIEAIKSILTIDTDAIQITIADNSDTNIIESYLKQNPNLKIVYSYDRSAISSIENFNRALGLASGEYVCMIGDDDTVLPNIMHLTRWMKENNVESVSSKRVVDFFWPNPQVESLKTGELIVPKFTGMQEKVDLKSRITKLFADGIVHYQGYYLPRIYHGIIKMTCMEKIRTMTGHYFGGLSPDIYSTVSLACLVKTHYVISLPFTIAGACPSSTSVANITGGHSGILSDAPHFRNRGNYDWENIIPRYYSVETIWAESALKAAKEMNRYDLYELYRNRGIYRFLVYGWFNNRKHIFNLASEETLKKHKDLGISELTLKIKLLFNFSIISVKVLFKKAFNVMKFGTKTKDFKSKGIHGLDDAVFSVNKVVGKDVLNKLVSFDLCELS